MLPSNESDLLVLGAAEPDWLITTGSVGPTAPDDAPGHGSSAPLQDAPRPSASCPPLPPFQSTGLAAFGSVVGDPMDMADSLSSDAALLLRMQGEEWQQGVGTLNPASTSVRPSRRPSAAGRLTTPALQPASAAAACELSQQQRGQGQQCEIGVSEPFPLEPGACLNAGLDTADERGEGSVQQAAGRSPVVPVVPVVPGYPPKSGISAPRPASSRSMRQSTSKVTRQCDVRVISPCQ